MASETAKLLEALFLDDPDSYIELRVINRATGARQEWFSASDTAAAAARAVELRDRGDVYFGVVPRIRREGTKDAVGEAQVVWADVDSADAVVGLAMFGVAPSIVVASGSTGCYHAYWLLTTRVSAGVLEDLNRRLANRLDADQRATDCSRVLRVLSVAAARGLDLCLLVRLCMRLRMVVWGRR